MQPRERIMSIGNTNAMEREITVAYNDFSIASMKLWVEKEIHLVTNARLKTVSACVVELRSSGSELST